MYSKILVPLDGSKLAEQILPYVRFFSEKFGSHLELVQIVPSAGGEHQQRADEYLKGLAQGLESSGKAVSTKTLAGDASEQIINESISEAHTLVAMSNCGHSGLDAGKLGGVVESVLGGNRTPLLIIRSQSEEDAVTSLQFETIIAPLDGSPLAEEILDEIASLAKLLETKIVLVRATPPTGSGQDFLTEYPQDSSSGEMVDIDITAEEYLKEMSAKLQRQGVQKVEGLVLHGDPAVAIVEFAQQIPNNLVAMTTHGRSGMGPWPYGSVTELVERHCCTPVLVIRPGD